MAEVASAYVALLPSARGWEREVGRQIDGGTVRAGKTAGGKAGKTFGSSFSGAVKGVFAAAGGLALGSAAVGFLKDSIGEAREAQKAAALTNQVIASTKGVANVSAKAVQDLSTAISNKIGVDDEAIQSGENLLLTFTNIRNEAGKGNKVFDRATHAAVDLGAALAAASGGQIDFRSASTLVGKALNDPIKGLTALQRVGVAFTKHQKDQIKALVDSGHTLGAQKIILGELNKEFGGAAASQATASDKMRVSVKNLEEQIGTALLPVIDNLSTFISDKAVPAISHFVTGMQDGTGAGGEFADVLKDARDIGAGVLHFFDSLPGPVKKYGAELLIASVAIGKLNNGLGGIFGTAGAATTRLEALGGTLRNVAGAGGMLLVAQSAHTTSTSLGVLEGAAGGALSGAALGAFAGPEGAAIGGAIGGLAGAMFSLDKHTQGAGDAAKVSLPSWKQYASTLDGVAASTTKATRDMVFQRLESSGLLGATRELGLTDRQAVSAVLGNVGARQKLATALRNTNVLTANQEAALERETGAVGASRLAQLKHNIAIAQGKDQLQKARTALRNFMAEPASKRVSITGVEGAIAQLSDLARGLREALGLTKDLNTAGPGGIDVLLSGPLTSGKPKGRRALGGPVNPNEPYIVNEREPEVFTSSQRGRLTPLSQLRGSGSGGSSRALLQVGDREFVAYMTEVADSRVDAAAAMAGETERAFG